MKFFVLRILRWICPPDLYESIEGDLTEQFEIDSREIGVKRAEKRFIWNTLRFVRPGIFFRNKFSIRLNHLDSLQHFFKIFARTTWKHASYSVINIAGLGIGLASSIFIFLWVMDETSFDLFHKDHDRIYQIMGNHTFPDGKYTIEDTPGPLSNALKELPEVENSCLINPSGRVLINYKDHALYEEGIYSDSSLFKVFTVPVLQGGRNPLPDNSSIAISQKMAAKHFDSTDPIGKSLRINNYLDAKVTAVFQDMPENSTLRFEFVLPYAIYAKNDPYNQEWGAWTGGSCFVKLQAHTNIESLTKKIHSTFTKPKIWPRWDTNVELFLFSLADWRLHGFKDDHDDGGRIVYVQGFTIVAVFILLIACVNFMNLSTARSVSRSKEVGVRKVIGATKRSLVRQFMGESILISFISLLFAMLLVYLLQPYFNELTGRQIHPDYTNPIITGGLIAITLFTGIVAGSYPAFFLSSLGTIQILKGKFSSLTGAGVRKALVVFQFSLSIILILCASVVYQQLDYMKNKNLGFDKGNVVYITTTEGIQKSSSAFTQELLKNHVIQSAALSDDNPMEVVAGMVLGDNAWPGKAKTDNIMFRKIQCDAEFLPSLGFTLVEGRNFSEKIPSDTTSYIINQEAARQMKLSDPIGQELKAPYKGTIVGIVKDFHSTGLHSPIVPVIIGMRPEHARLLFMKYQHGHAEEAVRYVQSVYKKFEPVFPLEYKFLDETFGRQYYDEIMMGKLSAYFTVMAIFISCLGLFGLASFTAEKRSKEISLRKVLGATVPQMITLLCRDFLFLVGIGLIIGIPVAWWWSNKYLNGFHFHTALSVYAFGGAAMSILAIALLTVSYQSVKAALSNAADRLSYE